MEQRILHIVGKMDRAGAETMLMNLYRNIDKSRFQFDFVVFTNDKGNYDEEIISLGGRIIPIVASNPIKRMIILKKFLQQHKEYKIVHAHTLFSIAFHLLAAKKAGIKYRIAHSHSTSDRRTRSLLGNLYHEIARSVIKKNATTFVACGKAAGHFLFPNQKDILFLPNSIDIEYWARIGRTEKNYIRDQFNFEGLKIIQVGRLQPVKNHMFTIKLAQYMKDRNISFKIFIVGEGDLERYLKQEVEDKKLENMVVFLGLRSDIPQLMAGADVMLIPSLHEGFPVVLVESQAVGLRSVIADTIPAEVDLGVQLINFVSLEAPLVQCVELILKENIQKMSVEERIEQLSRQGFDIKNNALKLVRFYSSMQ